MYIYVCIVSIPVDRNQPTSLHFLANLSHMTALYITSNYLDDERHQVRRHWRPIYVRECLVLSLVPFPHPCLRGSLRHFTRLMLSAEH